MQVKAVDILAASVLAVVVLASLSLTSSVALLGSVGVKLGMVCLLQHSSRSSSPQQPSVRRQHIVQQSLHGAQAHVQVAEGPDPTSP